MKPKEKLEIRKEMVSMHDEYLTRLNSALQAEMYVEAVWLCYSIFEQRITRLIEKHISYCPRQKKVKGKPAAISTRIACVQHLIAVEYGGYKSFDSQLLSDILTWCERRNDLVHGLVTLDHYKKYDVEFKQLAHEGEPLVQKLYEEVSKFRKWYYEVNSFDRFPEFYCRCKKQKCIYD